MPDATLLVIHASDDSPTRTVELTGLSARIGRGTRCEVRLDDPRLAEVQCILRRRGPNWSIQPVGPAGLIELHGHFVEQQQPLPFDAPLRVGDLHLTLRPGRSTAARYEPPQPRRAVDPTPFLRVRDRTYTRPIPASIGPVVRREPVPRPEPAAPSSQPPPPPAWRFQDSLRKVLEAVRRDQKPTRLDSMPARRAARPARPPEPLPLSIWLTAPWIQLPAPPNRLESSPPRLIEAASPPILTPAPAPTVVDPATPHSAAPRRLDEPAAVVAVSLEPEPAATPPIAPAPLLERPREPRTPRPGRVARERSWQSLLAILKRVPAAAPFRGREASSKPIAPEAGPAAPDRPAWAPAALAEPSPPAASATISTPVAPPARPAAGPEPAGYTLPGPRKREQAARAAAPREAHPASAPFFVADTATSWRTDPPGPVVEGEDASEVPLEALPRVRDVMAAVKRRDAAATAAPSRPRPGAQRVVPLTAGRSPSGWKLPGWFAGVAALVALAAVGMLGMRLALVWAEDDRLAGDLSRLVASHAESSAPIDVLPPFPPAAWWRTTARHLHLQAVATDLADREGLERETVRGLLESASAVGPLEPGVRMAMAETGEPTDLGLSRDVVSLGKTARRLLQAGQVEPALRAYRSAIEVALRGDLQADGLPEFLEDRPFSRFTLPLESTVSGLVAELMEWSSGDTSRWLPEMPESGLLRLVVARQLLQRGDPAASTLLEEVADARPGDNPEAIDLAVCAEAFALLEQWEPAALRYREAIARVPDGDLSRTWWFNLAEMEARQGHTDEALAAWDQARSSDLHDAIHLRLVEARARHGLSRNPDPRSQEVAARTDDGVQRASTRGEASELDVPNLEPVPAPAAGMPGLQPPQLDP